MTPDKKLFLLPLWAVALFLASSVAAADFVVVNANATGPGSLGQAITDANNLPGADRIVFNIPGSGVHTIDVSNNYLPKITEALTIDGYTQPGSKQNTLAVGSNATVLIRIDGAYYDSFYYQQPPPVGLWIAAPDCTIRGLMITRFSPFTVGIHCCEYSAGFGIIATDRSVIEGNFIGTDGSASIDLGNRGVGIVVSGSDYRIGGTSAEARNMIGGNRIASGGGGPADGPAAGIRVGSSTGGLIVGNHIGQYTPSTGSNGAGTEGAPNDIGIVLSGTLTDTVLGGTTPGAGNVISGNDTGIRTAYLHGGSGGFTTVATGASIQGNFIGAAPNAATTGGNVIGIELLGSNNDIGGSLAGAGNLIGSNGTGIKTADFNQSTANSILGNELVANTGRGIWLVGSDNQIGGLAPGAGNHIHLNGKGIVITGDQSQQNRILSNLIDNNTSVVGIDLNADGPTSNDLGDADTGPNQLQNFPVITSTVTMNGTTTITGALNSTPSSTFTLQFFGNLIGEQIPTLLDTRNVTTDANGNAPFQVSYPGNVTADTVTATATDAAGDTSEMTPFNGPAQLANISTRGFVGTGDNILIAGFVVRGSNSSRVGIRALGPSVNVPNRLADPTLELRDSGGTLLAKNDDWKGGQQQEVMDAGLAPSSDLESALIATIAPGSYTALVRGVNNAIGDGVVEVYDLDSFPASTGRLVNLSSRAPVGVGDDILIAGMIVRGDAGEKIVLRALGPDLSASGVPNPLQDPTLELHDSNGNLVAENDNWRDFQGDEIPPTLQPTDDRDSAIAITLAPTTYTAIVRGTSGTTGIAVVEFYDLKN
jgi:hypothetical protein